MNFAKILSKSYLYFLPLIFLFSACTNGNDSSKESSTKSGKQAVKSGQCILSYQEHLGDLLTQDLISKHFPEIDFANSEVIDDGSSISPKYAIYGYSWEAPGGATRQMKAGSTTINVPVYYSITFGKIAPYVIKDYEKEKDPINNFKNRYRTLTKEELAKAKEAINKQINKEEELTASQKEMASGLGGGIASRIKFEPVEGVGDAAVWDFMDKGMKVLVGSTVFFVSAKVSEDVATNQAITKALAKDLIQQCR